MKKTVSVIIPVYKPNSMYVRLLKGLKYQTYPIKEIIVINTEQRYYHEENYPSLEQLRVIHIKKEEFDHGGTRNAGAKMATGDILLFMTQDAVLADAHVIERLVESFDDDRVEQHMPDNCRMKIAI